jgi:integrase/recombinase XerC
MELRDRCITELLLRLRPRLAELEGLDVRGSAVARCWIDADAGEAHVLGKGNKRRIVPVGGAALTALSAWLAARDGWERAGTRWRCLSARVAPACRAAHSLAPQAALQSRSGYAGASAHVAPFVCQSLGSPVVTRARCRNCCHASITTQVYNRLDRTPGAGVRQQHLRQDSPEAQA